MKIQEWDRMSQHIAQGVKTCFADHLIGISLKISTKQYFKLALTFNKKTCKQSK